MGLIYQISCNITSEKYIGSTKDMKRFNERKCKHKAVYNMCSSKQITDRGNYEINIIEENNLQDIELKQREQEFIDRTENTVNKIPAYQTDEERRENNRKSCIKYYQDNKEKLNLERRWSFTCECGGKYTYIHKRRHFKTKKHMNYLLTHS